MTGNERFDDSIGNWLQAAAPDRLPQRVLEATFERTRRTRQGRAWRAVLGTRRVTQMAPALAGAAVVVAAVVAVSVIPSLSPAATPSPSPSATLAPSTSPVAGTPVWPQTSLEEARQAQALADAGDRNYTWQVSPRWVQPGQHHPMSLEFFDRFLKEKLGWDNATWDEAFAHREGLKAGDVIFVRCGPDGTNPLYPNDPAHPLCAPTLDDYRYETVKVHVTQPVKEGEAGIFVVTGWEMIEPAVQVAPASDAEIAASLGAFLRARVDGAGAEGLVDFDTYDDPLAGERVSQEIPLLYATSDGAPYKRSEFEVIGRPEWPTGGMSFKTRLFTENDATVVEQQFGLARVGTAAPRVRFGFDPTTENGQAVPETFGFLDGEVTYRVTAPLGPSQDGDRGPNRLAIEGLLPNDDNPRKVLLFLADPQPLGPRCGEAPLANAEALARSIQGAADFAAHPPVPVTVGGLPALQLDVMLGSPSGCSIELEHSPGTDRARLTLVDLPPGGAARILVLATVSDADSIQTVLGYAAPVIASIEFHAPGR